MGRGEPAWFETVLSATLVATHIGITARRASRHDFRLCSRHGIGAVLLAALLLIVAHSGSDPSFSWLTFAFALFIVHHILDGLSAYALGLTSHVVKYGQLVRAHPTCFRTMRIWQVPH